MDVKQSLKINQSIAIKLDTLWGIMASLVIEICGKKSVEMETYISLRVLWRQIDLIYNWVRRWDQNCRKSSLFKIQYQDGYYSNIKGLYHYYNFIL